MHLRDRVLLLQAVVLKLDIVAKVDGLAAVRTQVREQHATERGEAFGGGVSVATSNFRELLRRYTASMNEPELVVRVLVGMSLLLQAVAGWFAFVAYLDENMVRAGSKDASHALNGRLLSGFVVKWRDGDNQERWPFRITHKYFGVASRPSGEEGDVPFRNGGCRTAAKGTRFLSYMLAGTAFYVSLIFDVPIARLIQ